MRRTEWDQQADEFEDLVCDITREETSRQLSRFVRAVRPSRRLSVLVDLGCGLGSFILKHGSRFHSIYGVDFSPRILARAKERCADMPGITWLEMGIERSAKAIGPRADLTVCFNVITSSSAAKRKSLWSSLAAVTKPGGYVLVVVPSIESHRMVEEIECRRGVRAEMSSGADGVLPRGDCWQKHYASDELKTIMSREGFRVESVGEVLYPWSSEGLRKPRSRDAQSPWDWVCFAQRV